MTPSEGRTPDEVVYDFVTDLAAIIDRFAVDSTLHIMMTADPSPDYLSGYRTGVEMTAKLLRKTLADWKATQ